MADAAAGGTVYISPYDNPLVIAGAGTVALEMLRERPEIDTLVIPLGGGGLLSGAAIVARALRPAGMRLIGAEARASAAFTAALAAGRPVPGLYAAGACASNIAQDSDGYSSGVCLGEASYFGRRAGRAVAARS